MGIEAILALCGAVIPPVANFVNKKFLKRDNDTAEATASSLAVSNPEQLGPYLSGMSSWYETLIKWFNRDVIGTPSQWVVDLRSAIRPLTVVTSIVLIAIDHICNINLAPETRGALLANISSWFSSRLPG